MDKEIKQVKDLVEVLQESVKHIKVLEAKVKKLEGKQ